MASEGSGLASGGMAARMASGRGDREPGGGDRDRAGAVSVTGFLSRGGFGGMA
jgi:hypothetical protein